MKRLEYAAGGTVLISGAVHLVWGIGGLVAPGLVGVENSTLSVLFLLAALLAFGFVAAFATRSVPATGSYVLGAALLGALVVAYVDWHVLGFVESVVPADSLGGEASLSHGGEGHAHGDDDHRAHDQGVSGSFVVVLVDHFRADPVGLFSKTIESVGVVLFGGLAISTWTRSRR